VDGFGAGAAASEENQRHRPPWTAGFWESKSSPGKCEETILKGSLFAFYCVKMFHMYAGADQQFFVACGLSEKDISYHFRIPNTVSYPPGLIDMKPSSE